MTVRAVDVAGTSVCVHGNGTSTEVRPIDGMSHAVFADLGAGAGTLVADRLIAGVV